jgi:hypothetical protein
MTSASHEGKTAAPSKHEGEYPEHDKLAVVRDESQAQGEFLEWLRDTKGMALCDRTDSKVTPWFPTGASVESLLAEYHGIDRDRLEKEKRHMLAELRKAHAA